MRKKMNLNAVKKYQVIAVILLFIGTAFIPSMAQDIEKSSNISSRGHWLYVGGSGPGNYTKIQDAVNASSDGDTVFVYNGTYSDYVRIDKSISLIGENKNTTIIEGGWGTFVYIRASRVLVTGFTIRECGFYYAGDITISSQSNNDTIIGNILTQSIVGGIYAYGNDNIIANNSILGNARGISFEAGSHNIITGNIIESNNVSGIIFVEIRDPNNPISNNTIVGNIIRNNKIGIWIQKGNYTLISNNLITSNRGGIDIGFGSPLIANNNSIENNIISYNTYGLYLTDSNNNHIYHNNFIENTNQAFDGFYEYPCINHWDDGYPSGGNFWSDYNRSDNYNGPNQDIPGSDGIGDTPYNITGFGTNSKDRYPLMYPFGPHPEFSVSGHGGLCVSIDITNTGNKDATDFGWNVTITGGVFGLINFSENGSRDTLEIGKSFSLTFTPFGIGKFNIDIVVEALNVKNQFYKGRGFLVFSIIFPIFKLIITPVK